MFISSSHVLPYIVSKFGTFSLTFYRDVCSDVGILPTSRENGLHWLSARGMAVTVKHHSRLERIIKSLLSSWQYVTPPSEWTGPPPNYRFIDPMISCVAQYTECRCP